MMKRLLISLFVALPAMSAACAAQTPTVTDAWARSANPRSGAVLVSVHNGGDHACRLVGAASDAADSVMLHGVKEVDGMITMVELPDGLEVPAGGDLIMDGSGDHIMLMGLKAPVKDGDAIAVTLDFGDCGTVPVTATVDNARAAAAARGAAGQGHGAMDHGAMGHGGPAATAPAN